MSVIIVLPGGGAATGGTSFTFNGADTTNTGATSDFISTTIDIGPATADRYVIIAATDQNAVGVTAATVNGVNLAFDTQETATRGCYIWSGLVGTAGGAGVATILVAYTAGLANFSDRIIMVWTGRGMTHTTGAATTATGASTLNIAVTAGDFLIAAEPAGGTGSITFGGPETPTASHTEIGAGPVYAQTGAEWNRIVGTNAAFGITTSVGGTLCAATYH